MDKNSEYANYFNYLIKMFRNATGFEGTINQKDVADWYKSRRDFRHGLADEIDLLSEMYLRCLPVEFKKSYEIGNIDSYNTLTSSIKNISSLSTFGDVFDTGRVKKLNDANLSKACTSPAIIIAHSMDYDKKDDITKALISSVWLEPCTILAAYGDKSDKDRISKINEMKRIREQILDINKRYCLSAGLPPLVVYCYDELNNNEYVATLVTDGYVKNSLDKKSLDELKKELPRLLNMRKNSSLTRTLTQRK